MLLAYVVVVPGGELLSGVDLQTPFGTAASVVKGRGAGRAGRPRPARARRALEWPHVVSERPELRLFWLAAGSGSCRRCLARSSWSRSPRRRGATGPPGLSCCCSSACSSSELATSSFPRLPPRRRAHPIFGARRVPVHVRAVWAHPRRKRDHRPSARRDHRADDPGHDPGHVVLSAAAHERCADRADRRARALELLVVPARIGSVEDRGRRARCAAKAAAENYARASRCCTDALALWAA